MSEQKTVEQPVKTNIIKQPWFKSILIMVIAIALIAGALYWQITSSQVSIDNSQVLGTQINLSPTTAGTLQDLYVKDGDQVGANTVVAQVGNELIKTKVAGTIIAADDTIGTSFSPGQTVVSMIDPGTLRAVGTIDENKGLDRIQVGQRATFTVDAFGSKTYNGIVDEISPTANSSGVVFNISDQRQTQQFDVKVRFDVNQYPELKNGMSAKITVYTK